MSCSVRARSGCTNRVPGRGASALARNCAREAGKRASRTASRAIWRLRTPSTRCPSRARRTAGATNSCHGSRPNRRCTSNSPATVPGTLTERWPVRDEANRLPAESTYMERRAAAGATSRKSSVPPVSSRVRRTMNPPPPMLPATGGTTAPAGRERGICASRIVHVDPSSGQRLTWGHPNPCMTVPAPDYRDPRLTEQRNPRTQRIDVASSLEIVDLINAEDATVAPAVHAVRADVARAIDLVVDAFRRGGRLVYVGAGTSGRLGVLDASECPPTFGTPPEMVVGVIAGGYAALVKSSEGAEDDVNAGMEAMDQARVTTHDFVLGIAASGTTPFVRAALSRAQTIGATTGLVSCSDPPQVLRATCDVLILPKVGPEVLTGSTRMKAGTATKLVLNTVSTGAMIRLGRAYGNLMVDLKAVSDKLRDRGERIAMECCGVDRAVVRGAVVVSGGRAEH